MRTVVFKTSQVGLHMVVAFAVTYGFTGSVAVGGLAAVVEPICNVTLMPLHDKLWNRYSKKSKVAQPSAASDLKAHPVAA